jgi:hypothetical protein
LIIFGFLLIPLLAITPMKKPNPKRLTRLQVMLSADELTALDNFRFENRMPSLAAAIREILRRGLTVNGFARAGTRLSSSEFGVLDSGGGNGSAAAAIQEGIDQIQKPTIGKPVKSVRAERAKGNGAG